MELEIKKSCKNIIHITFYTKDADEAESIYRNICKEIEIPINELEEEFNLLVFHKNGTYHSEIVFDSYLVSPVEKLQELCIKYKIDMIGVGFDFYGGYVNSFELFYDVNENKEENHYISLKAENKENDSTFPLNEDNEENVLDSDEITFNDSIL